MIRSLPITDFLSVPHPVIDVRSPGEFAQGHVPGAHNVPLFTNEERAVVGTLYKQQGRDAAVLQGLRLVGPKLAAITERAVELAPDGRIRVHCWRGGERSGSVAWLLDKAGFAEVLPLIGGYKAFRNHVLASFAVPRKLAVVGGHTGTGKTEILSHLAALGQHTIDLESLANHKGSSFGALGEPPQPTNEQFENAVWGALHACDPREVVWIEDESGSIGRVKIPDAFFRTMRGSPCYFLEVPKPMRASRLVEGYGGFPRMQLIQATERIAKRIGPQHCKAAVEALHNNDLYTAAMITLTYYDKTYLHGVGQRDPDRVFRTAVEHQYLKDVAGQLIEAHAAFRYE
ncbi:MAG: tRNA 2-selenouridine(34) synthase MnmH [Flavobacteriales bacterium]|nr:tRNA 2-selenouridine(34) synthase MnmH [Flavobacteriales bacterium]